MTPARRGRSRLGAVRGALLLVVVALAGATLTASPAGAATCSTSSGVSVVVDFHQLPGGVQTGCDPDGAGRAASAVFPAAGFPLEYVQSQPGFVCRVSQQPATASCARTPPPDAYWSLWWSDGSTSQWTYSTLGVGSLKVPAGGSVAFSWQQGSGRVPPSQGAPVARSGGGSGSGSTTSPTRSPRPTRAAPARPRREPTAAASPRREPRRTAGRAEDSAPRTSASPRRPRSEGTSRQRARRAEDATAARSGRAARPSSSPSADPTVSATPGATTVPAPAGTASPRAGSALESPAPAQGGGGLPGWALGAVIVALAALGAAVAWARRT